MKKGHFVVYFLFILACIGIVSAVPAYNDLHVTFQTTYSNGSIETGTFLFTFNISSDPSCNVSYVVYSNSTIQTTDARGIVSYYLPNVNLDYSQQYWLCYYQNGAFIDSSELARVPYSFYSQSVPLSGVNINTNLNLSSYNATANYGFFNSLGSLLNPILNLFVANISATGTYFGNSWNITNGNFILTNQNSSLLYINGTNGNVGIGTTTPQNTLNVIGNLNVTGIIYGNTTIVTIANSTNITAAGGNGAIQFNNNGIMGGNSNQFFINGSTGNIGIGTTFPNSTLDVNGIISADSGGSPPISGPSGLGLGYYIGNYSWIQSYSQLPLIINPLGNNVGIKTTTPQNTLNVIGDINTTGTYFGNIWNITNGNFVLANQTSTLFFINGTTGNVGIGTTNPTEPLTVYALTSGTGIQINGSQNPLFQMTDGTYTTTFGLASGSGSYSQNAVAGDFVIRNEANGSILFSTNSTNNFPAALDIQGITGYVGIGTTSPSQKLEVNGNEKIDGTLYGIYKQVQCTYSSGTTNYCFCGAGYNVTGGGAQASSTTYGISASYPYSNATGAYWVTSCVYGSGTYNTWTATYCSNAWAICMKVG